MFHLQVLFTVICALAITLSTVTIYATLATFDILAQVSLIKILSSSGSTDKDIVHIVALLRLHRVRSHAQSLGGILLLTHRSRPLASSTYLRRPFC